MLVIVDAFLAAFLVAGCGRSAKEAESFDPAQARPEQGRGNRLAHFIEAHVAKVEPLSIQANLAYWDASTTGKAEDYDRLKKLQLDIHQVYGNRDEFALLKELRESGEIKQAPLSRQLDRLYYAYLQNQIEPTLMKEIVDLDTKIQERYSTFRATIDGEAVTMSDIYTILTTEKDCRKRELAWRASKQVGNAIAGDLIQLVRLRNKAARELGFDNYHTFSIITSEQNPQELDRIFEQLYELTSGPFARLKAELDQVLADAYGIKPADLMPWHYHDPFFQRTPLVYDLDLDQYYQSQDVRKLAQRFYAGVGLPVDDILARSDLYDRPGKYPHAFSHDIDRRGDVRILCNLQNTERWMETILHELGHAIYSKYHDQKEPWLLREPAHSFTTEGIAVLFGRLSRNAAWMHEMLGLSQACPEPSRGVEYKEIDKVSWKYTQFGQILFARWAMVMYYFEKQLYANPDQDLNKLWWNLVEKYQLLRRPGEPFDAGWASKLHFTSAPCYYHNYMLGEILASQLHQYIVHKVLKLESDKGVSYVDQEKIGKYLREKVFGPGACYHWNEMIRRATGEPLTPRYFVDQFIN
jgi:peptidyl-dipeptidase A